MRRTRILVLLAVFTSTHCAVVAAGAGFSRFATAVQGFQEIMIAQAKAADPAAVWTVDEHARGKAVIIEDGEIWEKGCISVTLIEDGKLSSVRAATISGRTGASIAEGAPYSACALSFVLHARSPLVPTLRGDVRVFVVGDDEWYGGGLDLTPSYVELDDCTHFHQQLSQLCTQHGEPGTYSEMKQKCDEYFYLPCRQECRGVGGIFFDDLSTEWAPALCEAILRTALDPDGPYMPIVRKRLPLAHSEGQKQWQLLRRGRYIEFNLLCA